MLCGRWTLTAFQSAGIPFHAERLHRPLDVLERKAAEIVEGAFSRPATASCTVTRDHDAAGRRFGLQARRHVHAIAVEVVAIHDQVAKVQADAEHDGGVLGLVPVGLGHGLLELDGGAQSVHGAWELDQGAVAGQLDQPSAMASQNGLQPLGPMGFQPGKGAVLITAHQARVANDIRRQNRRQSPYNPLAGQEASPKGYSLKRYGPIARAGLHLRYWARRCRLYFRPLNRRSLCGLDRSVGPDRCLLPLFAPSRRYLGAETCPLPRGKRTWRGLAVTSESDPKADLLSVRLA